jgi:ABC-type transport system, involved in lipoprotein release, permease component
MKTNLFYALRNIRKNQVNSVITVIGLSIAIACSLIIFYYVSQENSFDQFHKNADKIYRINYKIRYVFADDKDVRVEPEVADQLKKEIPQIEKSAEYRSAFQQQLRFNNIYYDIRLSIASEDFFDMFSFKFIAGKPSKTLGNPFEIVLTKSLANKLVSSSKNYNELIGKGLEFPLNYPKTAFKIVGIIEDVPRNSSLTFEAVVSGKTGRNFGGCDNNYGYTSVFYQLRDNANAKDANKNVTRFISRYYKARVEEMQNNNQLVKTGDAFEPFVLPLRDLYLTGDISNCFQASISKGGLLVLMTLGLLILIIACSNYTILSLGQYLKKVGDVGIRKAMGANTGNIFAVFLSEGFILTLAAFLIGGMLCSLFIPMVEELTNARIYTEMIDMRKTILFCLILFTAIVAITSIVPVIVFSKVSPHQMAGKKLSVGSRTKLSQFFVAFQYSVSIILIIVTLFIVRQANFLKNQPLGFNTNHIIDINLMRMDNSQKEVFKKLISENPGVTDLTLTSRNFMDGESDSFVDKGNGEQIDVCRFEVDNSYISTLGLKLLQGNDFTEKNMTPTDRSMIVNRKFVETFGIEDEPIGKSYSINGLYFTIIGVVDDYQYFDMRTKIRPAMLTTRSNLWNSYYNLLVKFQPAQLNAVIKHIKNTYADIAPGTTLTYTFWDEQLRQQYESEERSSKIVGFSSIMAIIISSLGLFGLTILIINQRIKEVGIRKVNGATAWEVMVTFYQSFITWLLGSFIISLPIAYYIVNAWLSNFPYKVNISWWTFIIAGVAALAIAIITVSWQTYRAASRNPIESLRYE